ncbi:hypothetical protein GCM10025876_27960 [Demequina litorisediminis]|uniref:Uronate isomerase n=1 Tax=Demequina litorisediminis TaxID=1849022 RepID=A0ABQ6IIM3_9MICO|nr:hypothetical protein GCM10025876_27960 [Demequina litorisediminis]
MEHVLEEVLGVTSRLSAENADQTFDAIAERLAEPGFRPLALLDSLHIEILATTDAADDPLASHARLAADGYGERVVPTFRPDAVVNLDRPDWLASVRAMGERAGVDIVNYATYIEAIESRRAAFVAAGARATDHGHLYAETAPLSPTQADRMLQAALAGKVDAASARIFAGHMLTEMARMSCEDGLVMQLHPGVLRDYDARVFAERGPDVGYDIPIPIDHAKALRPLLNLYGHDPRLTLVLFTVDEDVFGRELAPLAGSTPRCASVPHGGSSIRPMRCAASVTPSPTPPASTTRPGSSTTPGRSCRSPPVTTWPGASTRATWRGWSPSIGCPSRRRPRRPSTLPTRSPAPSTRPSPADPDWKSAP